MDKYHKIQSVYKREPKSKFRYLIEGDWSIPEFGLLKNIEWIWTEKIDGTNIRILYNESGLNFKGKSDNAEIPKHLLKALEETFTLEMMQNAFPNLAVGETVCLYGEGYGQKIQRGGNYLPDSNAFILFDVKIGSWWFNRDNVEDVAIKLNIQIVPIIGKGTLIEAIDFCKTGYKSTIAHNKDYIAEGLVMKPSLELFARNGTRIITKVKYKDFNHEKS